jgi:D-beta-D-heptose 7-phosphate kinase/D-beta-D-heptose 1-phosphate adenosyltransferase
MDRAHILSALEVVDYVIIFDEDTPFDLINAIKPDILVKGGDYKIKDIVGWKIAKETKIIKFIDDKSTTKIINKIMKN